MTAKSLDLTACTDDGCTTADAGLQRFRAGCSSMTPGCGRSSSHFLPAVLPDGGEQDSGPSR